MTCRRDLEGTGLVLTKHLTDNTRWLRSETSKIVGNANTSVYKTRVYAKTSTGYIPIKCQKDLDTLKDYCSKFPKPGVSSPVSTGDHDGGGRFVNNSGGGTSYRNTQ